MNNMEQKIEIWKNKLLDLGKRNRLINYRDTKRSNLRIKHPGIFELWDSFVLKEIPLEFPYYDDFEITFFEDQEVVASSNGVVTNQSIKDQQKTLRSIRDKAKTAIEEQGVNVLYLAFGFLKWSEINYSEQYYLSPIILVPVSLTWESITSPFMLNLHEDEIVVNPTLAYKLENDFGIILPSFDPESSINEYFNEIDNLVAKNKWEVVPEVGLSLFSFLKINMYKDLDKHKDKILRNSVVRSLCGDTSALDYSAIDTINNFNHDKEIKPIDSFQVVDADSSQQDAILCAKKGVSFVLQGPPGTGKSQTITNIIAECLADGKKVLFVSEKMAALEVVYKRLTNAELSEFCLTLHSHKANKKEVLEQLRSALNLSRKKATLRDEAFQKLDLLQMDKEKLNEYANAIFTNVAPLNKTIYEVNGYLANLQEYDDIIFNIDGVSEITPEKFNKYLHLLSQFTDVIGKLSDDYKSNPWNGANVPLVSNELRHDIGSYLNRLIPKTLDASNLCDKIEKELQLVHDSSYTGLTDLVNILSVAANSPKVPVSWITEEDISPLLAEIEEEAILKTEFRRIQNELSELYKTISRNDNSISFDNPFNINTAQQIISHTELIRKRVENDSCYSSWDKINDFQIVMDLFSTGKEKITEYNSKKSELLDTFEKEIFDIDFNDMYFRFKTTYNSIFKIFKRSYREDKNCIKGLYRKIIKKIDDISIVNTLVTLRQIAELKQWIDDNNGSLSSFFHKYYMAENTDFNEIYRAITAYEKMQMSFTLLSRLMEIIQQIDTKEAELKEHYEFLYNGIDTDWDKVHRCLDWAISFRDIVTKFHINQEFINNVCSSDEKIAACKTYKDLVQKCIDNLDIEFSWYLALFDNKDDIKAISMSALTDRLERCVNGLALLEEWIDFRTARKNCCDEGLKDFIEKIETMQIDVSFIIPMFKKRFYRLWLDAIIPKFPAVINFRRRMHESTIQEFATFDKLQFEIAKARIRQRLINNLPSLDHFTSGLDEISILKRELNKQRRIMPIRKLFKEIPNLLLTLKPCLMMSPLSVSLFLEAESYNFDTIIFDEASQVCTENAIGAISRGKQVIIAGDSKQLPPTNFFNATTSDTDFDTYDEEDDYDDTNAYESILDEAGLLPERTLLWHYRSRHEHLITFSNVKIYKNNLITFPSNTDKVPDIGVEYVYVKDGYYDRGGKKGNTIEAKMVAELVFEHFRKFPNRSLGVIAFGEVQQQAIDTAIRRMRIENQQFESFFKEDRNEAFFVKNLENVQGDERDTIIFSIGYAKDSTGKMNMNFGPLSKMGGERRLNVAITRAKLNVKLAGSIMPTDIIVERISSEGPKLLRAYIDFAINGPTVILNEITESDIVEHDSQFEAAVYNYLDRKGYKLATQVGCSGYRIDIAVKHPSISGRYVLGIECDGAAYHSARTARERDRLRQEVLEDMGWKIYRIWSTDWIKDPVTEGEKLVEEVERAIADYTEDSIACSLDRPMNTNEKFLTVDIEETSQRFNGNPYGFSEYVKTDLGSAYRDPSDVRNIANCIKAIVDNEYPIHYELLCQKLAPVFGYEKASTKVKNYVDFVIRNKMNNDVIKKRNFLYPKGEHKIIIRVPNIRPINHISIEELSQAMFIIAGKCVGTTKNALIVETARAYGFNRTGAKINNEMQKAYDLLLSSGRAKEVDGKIVINQ